MDVRNDCCCESTLPFGPDGARDSTVAHGFMPVRSVERAIGGTEKSLVVHPAVLTALHSLDVIRRSPRGPRGVCDRFPRYPLVACFANVALAAILS